MTRYVLGTRLDCEAYERLCRRAIGLPVRGVHVGGGRHVTIPDSPPGPGWTTAWCTLRKHPDRDEYACMAIEPDAGHLDTLSASEAIEIADEYDGAKELDSSWESKDVTPAEGLRVD